MMMLLPDFAVAIVSCTGGKKTHGNHFNNNIDQVNNKDSTEIKKNNKRFR